MLHRHALKIVALIFLLAAYAFSFLQVKDLRANLPPETKRAQALAVDPTILKIASGPFKGLVADYLSIKAAVFLGGAWDSTEEDWEAVYTLFKQSLYLDPMFFQNAYYIQGLLSWRKGMQQRAVDLLKYHADYRYWDWESMFYVGFDYFYYLKDNASAAECMKISSERPAAPPIAASLAVRLSYKAGQTLTAIAMLKTMYEQAQDEKLKEQYGKRLEAHLAAHVIEQAIEKYKTINGRPPHSLTDLVISGTIKELPENPLGTPFKYDPETGHISFDPAH